MRSAMALIVICLTLGFATEQKQAAEIGQTVTVHNSDEFRQAVRSAKPASHILPAPGQYGGNFYFTGVRGTREQPIVTGAADPARPPVFKGGETGLQFSAPSFL